MISFKLIKKHILLMMLFFLVAGGAGLSAFAESPEEKAVREAKVKEFERKENIEVKKLQYQQQKLEKTQTVINSRNRQLSHSRKKLKNLNYKINSIAYEQKNLSKKLRSRIRKLYMGEKITLLSLLLEAKDINGLLDSVYYQQKQANKDAVLIEELKQKSAHLKSLRSSISKEHRNINYTLKRIKREKRKLVDTIYTTEQIIERLRTDKEAYMQAENELAKQSNVISGNIRKHQSNKNKKGVVLSKKFMKPVAGRISSYYGYRTHPIFRSRSFHSGIDIAGRNWAPIRASNAGKVIYSGWHGGYGKVVIIDHGKYKRSKKYAPKNTSTLYAHLAKTSVKVGQIVKKGTIVGYEGSTGYSTGPHLHFEVRINGKTTNPVSYIK